jgi:hypothetical protein
MELQQSHPTPNQVKQPLKQIIMKTKKSELIQLSQLVKELENSTHPNVVKLLPLLKGNLKQYGDVTIDLNKMKTLMEI